LSTYSTGLFKVEEEMFYELITQTWQDVGQEMGKGGENFQNVTPSGVSV
jgi:hypothetical protein